MGVRILANGAWRLRSTLLLAFLLGCTQPGSHPHDSDHSPTDGGALFRATSTHDFADVDRWKTVFENPERDRWQRPADVVRALAIEPGSVVADLGAGTGYFLPYLVEATGAAGAVLACEVEPNLVSHLQARAEAASWTTVRPILSAADDSRIPRSSADLVLIVDTYHHIDHRRRYFERLADSLTAEGRVAVIDWSTGEIPVGPPPKHRIARDQVMTEMELSGYELIEESELLPYQYFLIFRPR